MSHDVYESPLSGRYASPYMLHLFSPDMRFQTWRRLWTALARAQHDLGLPVTEEQVRQLEQHITDIDYDTARQREREVRHDVMAHVYTYGKAAPLAAGIIHLGATSCYVTDNADLILYRDGLRYLRGQLLAVMKNLSAFAEKYAATPTLGYTHYQPAQPVTVGKRAALWLQDLLSDLEELDFVLGSLRFLGCRGTTGTEASFMDLFEGDEAKIDEMNRRIAAGFGFDSCFTVCGQTYPRKVDARILNCLSSMAQSVYRMANDIRLLQHDRQLEEPFEEHQIGSSAMAYKRNPMRCERICSLSRYLMADAMNAPMTASVQWMERTLDDSANRRLSMPEGFLCADAILRLAQNVTDGLRVNEKVVDKAIREYMPFLATENLMMEAVKRGGDRQELHERVRVHSMAATARMKDGEPCDLLDRLAADPAFGMTRPELDRLMDPARYIGRCPQQVRALLDRIAPLLEDASSADGGVSLCAVCKPEKGRNAQASQPSACQRTPAFTRESGGSLTEIVYLFLPHYAAHQKRQQVGDDHRGAHRGAEQIRCGEPRAEAGHGQDPRQDHHAPEALSHPHGRQGREDHQAGDQHSPHHPHSQHDGQGRQHGEERIVQPHPHTGGPGEALVEGDGEQLVVKQHEQQQHRRRQSGAEGHVRPVHGQNGAEHIAVHVRGHAGGQAGDNDAGSQGRGGHHGNGGIGPHAAVFRQPQQAQGRQDHHRDGYRQRGPAAGHGDGQGPEGHMAQAVADHGIPLEHQGHPQQRRAQGHQNAHHEGPDDEGIGKHFQQQAHDRSPPKRFP